MSNQPISNEALHNLLKQLFPETQISRRSVDLVAIQQLLGHWTVSSTMRYVRPSETFIEDAYRRAISATVGELAGQE